MICSFITFAFPPFHLNETMSNYRFKVNINDNVLSFLINDFDWFRYVEIMIMIIKSLLEYKRLLLSEEGIQMYFRKQLSQENFEKVLRKTFVTNYFAVKNGSETKIIF